MHTEVQDGDAYKRMATSQRKHYRQKQWDGKTINKEI